MEDLKCKIKINQPKQWLDFFIHYLFIPFLVRTMHFHLKKEKVHLHLFMTMKDSVLHFVLLQDNTEMQCPSSLRFCVLFLMWHGKWMLVESSSFIYYRQMVKLLMYPYKGSAPMSIGFHFISLFHLLIFWHFKSSIEPLLYKLIDSAMLQIICVKV